MTRSLLLAFPIAIALASLGEADEGPEGVLDHTVKDIEGDTVDLAEYEGDVLLIVNTASYCGYTPQYEGLEQLYRTYGSKGFEVLAFPANEFGAQEPGSNAEILSFCTSTYDVSFPLFSKIVVQGEGIHPLYSFLTDEQKNPGHGGEIRWNFTKFLVDRDGEVIARFEPADAPGFGQGRRCHREGPRRDRLSPTPGADRADRWASAVAHLLSVDDRWRPLIDRIGPCRLRPRPDRFGTLVRAIIGQQISSKAAASIDARLLGLQGRGRHAPDALLALGGRRHQECRALGGEGVLRGQSRRGGDLGRDRPGSDRQAFR